MPKNELLALVMALGINPGTERVQPMPPSATESAVHTMPNTANAGHEAADMETAPFLEEVYQLAESNHRLAAAKIMEHMDDLLHAGTFEKCKEAMDRADVSRLSKHPTLLIAFLGITLGAKAILSDSRSRFYSRAEAALTSVYDASRAGRILHRFQ